MVFFQKGELKLLWPFYLDALLSPMLFFAPAFFIPYFMSLNFSFFRIGVLLALPFLASLIFEIPTGAFADAYGRKLSVLVSVASIGIIFTSIYFVSTYTSLAILHFLFGIAGTFSTGAREAWQIDLIDKRNQERVHSFFTKYQSFDSFGLIVSGILGAYLVSKFDLRIIWLFGGASCLVSLLLLILAKEKFVKPQHASIADGYRAIKNNMRDSICYSKSHPVISYFLIASIFATFRMSLDDPIAWVPFLTNLGFKSSWFGYLWSAMALIGVIAPLLSHLIYKKNDEKRGLVLTIILSAILSFLVLSVTNIPFALVLLFLLTFLYSAVRPITTIYFHRFVPSKLRASIGSVQGMLFSLVAIIASPLTGLLLDSFGPKYTLFFAGIIVLPAAYFYSRMNENGKILHKLK